MVEQVLDRARHDDLAAVLPCTRTDVDGPVGMPDGVLVVLDHDQRVAEVLEPYQGLDQPVVVALVESDRRLVEHVQDTDETGADLGGEPDPLRLAAGQRAGRPVEREVVEADVEQEAQPLVDLLDDALGDLPLALGQLEVVGEEGRRLVDRQGTDLGDVLAADGDGQRRRLEPRTVAGQARDLAHEALEPLPARVALGLAVPTLDVGDDAFVLGVVRPLAPVPVLVAHVQLGRVSAEDGLAGPWP